VKQIILLWREDCDRQ